MHRILLTSACMVLALAASLVAAGQARPGAAGHWEGAIQVPGQELKIAVDLAPSGDAWEGTITIPAQGLKGFPLSGVTVQGETVTFAMKNIPGNPQFTATASKDGKGMSGELKQGGGTVPFSLTRTGDAKIERPPASTPITKDLEGSWEGTLDVNVATLRLVLTLANHPGGAATGTLVSVDQGGAEIPVAVVVQNGVRLMLALPSIAGRFDGEHKDGVLTGKWTQGTNTWPLVLKKK